MGRAPSRRAAARTLVTTVTDAARESCNTARMNIIRATLLVLAAVLIPGGLILLIPLIHRGYRSLVEARKSARQRAGRQLTLGEGQVKA